MQKGNLKFQKFRKNKIRVNKNLVKSLKIHSNFYLIQTISHGRIYEQHLKTIKLLVAFLMKSGKLYINVSPILTKTSKSKGSRMGKGKGDVDAVYVNIKPGTILFEISKNFPKELLKKYIKKIKSRLPFPIRVLNK